MEVDLEDNRSFKQLCLDNFQQRKYNWKCSVEILAVFALSAAIVRMKTADEAISIGDQFHWFFIGMAIQALVTSFYELATIKVRVLRRYYDTGAVLVVDCLQPAIWFASAAVSIETLTIDCARFSCSVGVTYTGFCILLFISSIPPTIGAYLNYTHTKQTDDRMKLLIYLWEYDKRDPRRGPTGAPLPQYAIASGNSQNRRSRISSWRPPMSRAEWAHLMDLLDIYEYRLNLRNLRDTTRDIRQSYLGASLQGYLAGGDVETGMTNEGNTTADIRQSYLGASRQGYLVGGDVESGMAGETHEPLQAVVIGQSHISDTALVADLTGATLVDNPVIPAFGSPDFGIPAFEIPGFEMPAFGTRAFQVPGFEVPGFDATRPQTPDVEVDASQIPVPESPKTPTFDSPGIH